MENARGPQPLQGRSWPSGFNNNVCFVVPEWDLVLVRMGTASEPGTRFDAFCDAVFGKIASSIKSSP